MTTEPYVEQSIPAPLPGAPGGGIITQKKVMIAMRDGVRLSTNIYRPASRGPHPVVLMRTPYGAESDGFDFSGRAEFYVKNGYVFAVQDCRGKFDSEGDWYGKRDEAQDGSDTITWLGTQPWSSGKVGMTGPSYLGMVQYLVADQENPYLKALVPLVAPTTLGRDVEEFDRLAVYGARESFGMQWMVSTDGRVNQSDSRLTLHAARAHLPLNDYPKIVGREMKWLDFFLNQTCGFWEEYYLRAAQGKWSGALVGMDEWWASYKARYAKITVPMLHISGWFDCCGEQPVKMFQLVRELATDPTAKNNQQLMMGPWSHGVGKSKEGEYDFGPTAAMNPDEVAVRWFDHWLKGLDNGVERDPPVRAFVMGENRWRHADNWPIPGTAFTKFYLHSDGEAHLAKGGGRLSTEPPADEPVDLYTYDPGNPTPAIVDLAAAPHADVVDRLGPIDMTIVEDRDDVLVYTSEVLSEPVEVTGSMSAVLYVSSTAPSTDLLVRLINVHPDGKPYNMFLTYATPYRTHWSKNVETAADGTRIIRADIDLPPTSIAFLKGHRIRIEISSASYPSYRSLNVEPEEANTATRWNIAEQTIFHDRERPSHVLLPVIPRGK